MVIPTMAFGGSQLLGLIGFALMAIPGLTIVLVAILPTDERIFSRWMMFSAGFSCLFTLLYLNRGLQIFTSVFDEGDRACVDYRGVNMPCWILMCQAVLYVILTGLCFYIGQQLCASLCSKQRNAASRRFELIWKLWGTFLLGYAFVNMVFIVLYSIFPEGRAFMGSTFGILNALVTIPTAGLGKFSFIKKWHTGVQSWLATFFGTVTDAMAVATFMSHRGDEPLGEVMATAKTKLRYVTFGSMDASDFDVSGGGRSHEKYAKSVHCNPRDIDLFVSHS